MRISLFLEGVSTQVLSFPSRGRASLRGNVQQVVDAICRYKEAGIEHVVLEMSTQSHESIIQTMEAFVSGVMPEVA
jgi:hypothetical protein